MSENTSQNFEYTGAEGNVQPEVAMAIKRFRELPMSRKYKQPLLWWLLGNGTPPLKMSKTDSNYQDYPFNIQQKCGTCKFFYTQPLRRATLCSQVSGEILVNGWCRLWAGE